MRSFEYAKGSKLCLLLSNVMRWEEEGYRGREEAVMMKRPCIGFCPHPSPSHFSPWSRWASPARPPHPPLHLGVPVIGYGLQSRSTEIGSSVLCPEPSLSFFI